MLQTVYVETTIPSAYVSARRDVGSLYRRKVTREWWDQHRDWYELYASQGVLDELDSGKFPGQREALRLLDGVPLLDVTDEALAIAGLYIRHRVMPGPLTGDALHMAVASLNEMDYLVTWNIRYLANPNKVQQVAAINRRLGLFNPAVVTPEWLWSEETR